MIKIKGLSNLNILNTFSESILYIVYYTNFQILLYSECSDEYRFYNDVLVFFVYVHDKYSTNSRSICEVKI